MKWRELISRLHSGGFRKVRDNGRHAIYLKPGIGPIPVPRHNELNEYTAIAILKQAGLL